MLESIGHSRMSCWRRIELGFGHSAYTRSSASTCSVVYRTYLPLSICLSKPTPPPFRSVTVAAILHPRKCPKWQRRSKCRVQTGCCPFKLLSRGFPFNRPWVFRFSGTLELLVGRWRGDKRERRDWRDSQIWSPYEDEKINLGEKRTAPSSLHGVDCWSQCSKQTSEENTWHSRLLS